MKKTGKANIWKETWHCHGTWIAILTSNSCYIYKNGITLFLRNLFIYMDYMFPWFNVLKSLYKLKYVNNNSLHRAKSKFANTLKSQKCQLHASNYFMVFRLTTILWFSGISNLTFAKKFLSQYLFLVRNPLMFGAKSLINFNFK